MSNGEKAVDRRTVLKGIGASAAALGAGGAGLMAMTGGAAATGAVNYSGVTATSDDGTVDHVSVYGDSVIEWTGFEEPARSFDVLSRVELIDSDGNQMHAQQINQSGPHSLEKDSWGGDGEDHSGVGTSGTIWSDVGLDSDGNHDEDTDWAIVQSDDYSDTYGLPANPAPASHLEVDEDGASANYTVRLKTTYRWFANADGTDQIFEETFNTNIGLEVNNRPQSASSSDGEGEDGAVAG